MNEMLKSPPLIEAICQFVFGKSLVQDTSGEWDTSIPDNLHDKIRDDFPDRTSVHRSDIQIPLMEGDRIIGNHVGPDIVQLKRRDMSAIVQVGENILIVNQLEPYPGWGKFKDLIIGILRHFEEVAKPGRFLNLGLRYINRIPVHRGEFRIGDYLNGESTIALNEKRIVEKFFEMIEVITEHPDGRLVRKTGLSINDAKRNLMLDIDFISSIVDHLNWRDAGLEGWLDEVHDKIYGEFVASLNPQLFGRMKRGEL